MFQDEAFAAFLRSLGELLSIYIPRFFPSIIPMTPDEHTHQDEDNHHFNKLYIDKAQKLRLSGKGRDKKPSVGHQTNSSIHLDLDKTYTLKIASHINRKYSYVVLQHSITKYNIIGKWVP